MTINRNLALIAISLLMAAGIFWIMFSETDTDGTVSQDDSLAWFNAGSFQVGLATIPGTPRVGVNDLVIKVRSPKPVVPGP